MRNRRKTQIPSQLVLLVIGIICLVLLFASYATSFNGGVFSTMANYAFIPMQKGFDSIGGKISVSNTDAKTKEELVAENEELQKQVDQLTTQLMNMQLQQSELTQLQELYKLDSTLDYETTGAHVIAGGSSNWFNTFTIDKGSEDGIEVDMNVIAGSGLVGIVTKVGKNYAVVRTVIDDTTNISSMVLSTGDNCIVSGSLELMNNNNEVIISGIEDSEDVVKVGDAIVTSNISDKYQPGILIGYLTELTNDANDLTKSGTVTPVVDFKHLQDVLVITEKKEVKD